jgi:NAD(P)-dependent dehydrogenase (short-subunit alcohol dehydrogenase family)
MTRFKRPEKKPDSKHDKTAIVTGGTRGIGQAIALRLAPACRKLIIVGHDSARGRLARNEISAAAPDCEVEFLRADLGLVREAEQFGVEAAKRIPALNYLVHSAGVVRGRRIVTSEGIESNFATNYLSRFALTLRLLPALEMGGGVGHSARILLISHPGFDGTIHYDDVNLTANFSTIRAFRQFHFANDLFAAELVRRLAKTGEDRSVTISCLHPGPTKNTSIDREMPSWMRLMLRFIVHPLASRPPDIPARAALKLLLADEYEGESGGLFSLVGKFKRIESVNGTDPDEGSRLWAFSENLIRSTADRTTGRSYDRSDDCRKPVPRRRQADMTL